MAWMVCRCCNILERAIYRSLGGSGPPTSSKVCIVNDQTTDGNFSILSVCGKVEYHWSKCLLYYFYWTYFACLFVCCHPFVIQRMGGKIPTQEAYILTQGDSSGMRNEGRGK